MLERGVSLQLHQVSPRLAYSLTLPLAGDDGDLEQGRSRLRATGPGRSTAMKANPKMKVLLTGGFQGIYEMRHLPIPQELQANIRYHYYEAGHMVYVNEGILRLFHDDMATFIHETSGVK